MNVDIVQGTIERIEADTIIVNLFDDVTTPSGATGAIDQALDGAISELIANGDLSGEMGEVAVFYPRGTIPAKRVLIAGLGKRDGFDIEGVRQASAHAIATARKHKAVHVASIVHGAGVAGLEAETAVQAVIEGTLLALYQYDAPRQKANTQHTIEQISIVEAEESKLEAIRRGVEAGQAIVAGVQVARDLVNRGPNIATPTHMAETAEAIAEADGLKVFIGDREWAQAQGMGAFLAVAQGAGEPPKFVVLEHNSERDDLETIVLVGKGITFDTGGISLKPPASMPLMIADMAGAAAVIGAMKSVALLNLPLRVIGITPCTENMPDAFAYRPADVITASNGKTIEIVSTDAEGRMALADALVYAERYQPQAVVDLATLTGSAVTALGEHMGACLFSTDEALQDQLVQAGEASRERVWPMPLWSEYKEFIKSDFADMKNSGGRGSGVGSSAVFLQEFVKFNWAHLDIAGMAFRAGGGSAYSSRGATGYGVRLLIEFLRNWKGSGG